VSREHVADASDPAVWAADHGDFTLHCGSRGAAERADRDLRFDRIGMSLLAEHPNVQFNCYRGGLGGCVIERQCSEPATSSAAFLAAWFAPRSAWGSGSPGVADADDLGFYDTGSDWGTRRRRTACDDTVVTAW